jgi:HNH endonuclease
MKLFHPEMEQHLNGVDIDRPFNAMTMTTDLHWSFGNLKWYLEEDTIQPEV